MGRTAKIHRLTDLAVRAYAKGQDQKLLSDGGGLYLRRLSTGCYWYLKITSPESKVTQWYSLFPDDPLARYPTKSLADARARAAEMWRMRAAGIEPRAEEARAAAARREAERQRQLADVRRSTVRQVFERWREADLVPRVRADGTRTGRKDGGQWVRESFERRVFPQLGSRPIAEVTRGDLLQVLDDAKAAGKLRTANVLLADLKQMFRFAMYRELISKNPLEGIDKRQVGGADVERQRHLSDDEILLLHAAIPKARLNRRSEAAIWLILATACRVGELLVANWKHVDLRARVWHLPETKNQRSHTIHLSDFALSHLDTLRTLSESSEWLFPARSGASPVSVPSFGKQLADRQSNTVQRLPNRSTQTTALCLPGGRWTAHDLRRTAATMMARLGVSTDVIDECLNHKVLSKVARVYIHDRRLPQQREAFDALGHHLAELTTAAARSRTSQVRIRLLSEQQAG
jgi:integrase